MRDADERPEQRLTVAMVVNLGLTILGSGGLIGLWSQSNQRSHDIDTTLASLQATVAADAKQNSLSLADHEREGQIQLSAHEKDDAEIRAELTNLEQQKNFDTAIVAKLQATSESIQQQIDRRFKDIEMTFERGRSEREAAVRDLATRVESLRSADAEIYKRLDALEGHLERFNGERTNRQPPP